MTEASTPSSGTPFSLDKIFDEASDLVNPPEDQIDQALTAAEVSAAAIAGASTQLTLPQFTPPVPGLEVTSSSFHQYSY